MIKKYAPLLFIILIVGLILFLFQKNKPKVNQIATPTSQPTVVEEQRPTAPEGYVWQECKASKSAFLRPNGWFFREEGSSGTKACFITKEEINDKNSEFETGLSVNGVKDVFKKTGMLPSAFVKNFFSKKDQKLIRQGKLIDLSMGPFVGYGQLVESQQGGEGIVQYNVVLGNDKTGSVYIMWFESPTDMWSDSWKYGQKIMETFAVDDEF